MGLDHVTAKPHDRLAAALADDMAPSTSLIRDAHGQRNTRRASPK
jgi:hypothetical protein